MKYFLNMRLFLFVIVLFITGPVFPVTAQQVPDTVRPGVSQRQFEKPLKTKSTPKINIPVTENRTAPDEADKIKFVLKGLNITGCTLFNSADLGKYYKKYLGSEISLKTVFDIAKELTDAYREKGYALSTVYVPAQEIDEKGQVKIIAVEGYIARVEFIGHADSLSPRNKRRLEALKNIRPISIDFLEQQVLLTNETPGIRIMTSIDRGSREAGALVLKVNIDASRYHFNAGINNRGSKAQGRERYDIGGSAAHVIGFDDLLSASVRSTFDSNEFRYYALDYTRLIHDTGTNINFGVSYSNGEPGVDILELLEYETENMVYRIGLDQPLMRSRSENYTLFYSFEVNNSESDMLGMKNSEQDVRTFRMGLNFDILDRYMGQTMGRFILSRGMNIFGATKNSNSFSSRSGADYTFTTFRADLYRLQSLYRGFSYFAQVSGQYAFDPLPYSEQHGYGGNFFGRAYDSSEISGDHSIMAGLELRYRVMQKPAWINSLEPFVFASAGRAWIREGTNDSGSDTGLGVKLKIFKEHNLSFEWEKPLNHIVSLEGDNSGRFFLGWNYRH